jgi:hypothetical protein
MTANHIAASTPLAIPEYYGYVVIVVGLSHLVNIFLMYFLS